MSDLLDRVVLPVADPVDAAEMIVAVKDRLADDVDATAIVITPRGGSRWIRLLTGDVALSLVTGTDRPVVVLPDDGRATRDGVGSG